MRKVNYGNRVPEKMLALYWIVSVLTGILFIIMQLCHHIFSPWMLSGLGLLYGRK